MHRAMRASRLKPALILAVLALSGCTWLDSFVPDKGATSDVVDRQQHLTVDDFRNLNDASKLLADKDKTLTPTVALGAPPLPDLAQVLAAPHAPKVANTKLVTISVTDDVPLRDVLFELGRLANVDIEVGPGLDTTGINLRVTDRPFNEVIERIAHLAKMRYTVTGNSIRVERDLPYIKNYSLDFLNIIRSSKSSYNLSTNVLSGGSSGSSSGVGGSNGGSSGSGSSGNSSASGSSNFGTTGSTSSIESESQSDLFSSLEASITEILSYSDNGASPDAPGALATAGVAKNGTRAGALSKNNSSFVVNRQSNVLTVSATDVQHEMINRYMTLLARNSSAQVLIEAKIVEVSLSDQFLSGVNWNSILGSEKNFVAPGTFLPAGLPNLGLPDAPAINTSAAQGTLSNAFSFGFHHRDLDAVVALTERFGTTRTLSSPRLSAINNQQAVLTFAQNQIYFNCSATAGTVIANTGTTGSTAAQPTINCQQSTVPIGIIMSILPSINTSTQEVTLSVRPTLTRQVGSIDNPANKISAQIANAGCKSSAGSSCLDLSTITSAVPIIEVRELDSIMKIKSGGVMVIGGLMEDISRNSTTGVPGAQEIPIFGNLFKSRSEDMSKRELIIFIKATIVNTDGDAQAIDKAVYEKYVTDPRPLFPTQ